MKRVREKEMASICAVSDRTFRNWKAKKLIPFTKVGRVVLYDPAKVLDALDKIGARRAKQLAA
jgi:DNA-binding transcriptional MerR regulator